MLHFCYNERLIHIGKQAFEGLKNLEEVKLSNNIALSTIDPYAFADKTYDNEKCDWLNIKKVKTRF